jgi:hypothetical protein
MCRGVQVFAHIIFALFGAFAFAQAGALPVVVTLGAPPPVAGQEFTVSALVTNPALSPAPTGSIQFNFGDGTSDVSVPMTYRVAKTTHTYSTVGSAQITATYSGDATFTSSTAVVQGQVLTSVPTVTLNVFGDSISAAGNTVSDTSTNWVQVVAYIHGWQLNNSAQPGYRLADECPYMYATPVTPSSYSAMLLGQNDFWGVSPAPSSAVSQYQNSLLACSAWLLIPQTSAAGTHPKLVAQDASVVQSGTWSQSSLFPLMGLSTANAGDSLTATVSGSTVYLGLTGTVQSNYTVDVFVDGQLAGEYNPSFVYSGNKTQAIPYGIRIPVLGSTGSAPHTVSVVCTDPGPSGCFVDWFGGNGFVAPNQMPLLWLGEPYLDNQPSHSFAEMLEYAEAIREMGQSLQSDGLGLSLADVFDNFDGEIDTQCMADLVHPSACGHQILAATYLGAMDWLFIKDQRIDFGQLSPVAFGSTAAVDVKATSELPVRLSVVSGPATINGNSVVPTAVGSVIVEADQSGNADYLAAAPATATIEITPAPVSVSIVPSALEVPYQGSFSVTAQVVWNGSGPVPGYVSLQDGNATIGTATLDSTGTATFANLQLAPGSHLLSGSYAPQGNFASGASPIIDVLVGYPPASLQITTSSQGVSLAGGQQVSFSLHLIPSLGFTPAVTFHCTGLPALASCQFSSNPLALGASGAVETVTIVTSGPYSNLAPVQAKNRTQRNIGCLVMVLAALFWSPGLLPGILVPLRRSKRAVLSRTALFLAFIVFTVAVFTNCGGGAPQRTPIGTSTVTITATAVQASATVTDSTSFQLVIAR